MANIPGVNVAGGITPYTTEDKYPSHYAKYGHGGYRTVETISDLYSISDERKENGMLVYVSETNQIFKYNQKTKEFELFEVKSASVELLEITNESGSTSESGSTIESESEDLDKYFENTKIGQLIFVYKKIEGEITGDLYLKIDKDTVITLISS